MNTETGACVSLVYSELIGRLEPKDKSMEKGTVLEQAVKSLLVIRDRLGLHGQENVHRLH